MAGEVTPRASSASAPPHNAYARPCSTSTAPQRRQQREALALGGGPVARRVDGDERQLVAAGGQVLAAGQPSVEPEPPQSRPGVVGKRRALEDEARAPRTVSERRPEGHAAPADAAPRQQAPEGQRAFRLLVHAPADRGSDGS